MQTFINSILAMFILSTSAIAADYNPRLDYSRPTLDPSATVRAELTQQEYESVVRLPLGIKIIGTDLLSRVYAVNTVKLKCARVWHTVPQTYIQALIEEESPAQAITDDILLNIQAGLPEFAGTAIGKQAWAQRINYVEKFALMDLRPLRSLDSQQEWCNVRGYFIIDKALEAFRVDNPGDDSVYKTFVEKKGHYLLALEELNRMTQTTPRRR